MSLGQSIRTLSAYGYNLGGPRAWNLYRFGAGDELRTAWYDEADPTHDFVARAKEVAHDRLGLPSNGQAGLDLPVVFVETLDVSPPGWTREASAPPTPSYNLPATSDLRSLDRVAIAQFVLVIADSLFDRDAEHLAHHQGDDYGLDPAVGIAGDPGLDWDRVLVDTLTTLGLEPVGMPDWLWFRSRWSDD
ncbi:hypothetical protein [Salinispora pacifica]|uniref:hypothetical protein n=1 Tax=Salinispora pacifica TaxID=351187 RepID=UPI0004819C2D|nr:hypothetical protein [Salinispora pacifica]